MHTKKIKKLLAAVLAVAMVVTSMSFAGTVKADTTLVSASDYTISASDTSTSTTRLTFTSASYIQYVIVHYTVNDGSQLNVNMSSSDGYTYTYDVTGLSTGDVIDASFTYNLNGAQYDTSSYSYTTGSSSTSSSVEAPFGLVVSCPSDNTIGVVWGRGSADAYNVYIDGTIVSSSVDCAYYEYSGYSAGTHTVAVTSVSGSSESEQTTASVYVTGSTTTTTTTTEATTESSESDVVVYLYQDINYGGTCVGLSVGDYNMSDLNSLGFANDDMSSIKVESGYQAILYWDIDFGGDTLTITSDTAWIGDTWNDQMTSIKVQKISETTTTTEAATTTTEAATTTTASTSTDTSLAQPFGLVVSCPSSNTIGVVWGRGDIDSYNVYIDGTRVASGVTCAYYEYSGYAAGTYTVSVATASGSSESAWTSMDVTVTGSGEIATTTSSSTSYDNSDSVDDVPELDESIPVSEDKMFLQLNNDTDGEYSDDEIYWCVLGYNENGALCYLDTDGNLIEASTSLNTLTVSNRSVANICHSLAECDYVYLPDITSGRMYLSYGSPVYITFNNAADGTIGYAGPDLNNETDPNINTLFEFIEFTVKDKEYWGNTTRVDFFSFPVVTRLIGEGGYDSYQGDADTYDRTVGDVGTRDEIFAAYLEEAPTEWQSLVTDLRILAPCKGAFNEGEAYEDYFDDYIDEFWEKYTNETLVFTCDAGTFRGQASGDAMYFTKDGDSGSYVVYKPSTQDVLEGKGYFNYGNSTELVIEAQLCAALNRGIATDPDNYGNSSAYYQSGTYNFYSKFMHEHSYDGLAYGFCYDDVFDQSTLLHYTNPTALVIDLRW